MIKHDDLSMSGAIAFNLIDKIEDAYQQSGDGLGFSGESKNWRR